MILTASYICPINIYNYENNFSNYLIHRYVPFTFTRKSELNFAFESKPYWLMPNQTESKLQKFLLKTNFGLNLYFFSLSSLHHAKQFK